MVVKLSGDVGGIVPPAISYVISLPMMVIFRQKLLFSALLLGLVSKIRPLIGTDRIDGLLLSRRAAAILLSLSVSAHYLPW